MVEELTAQFRVCKHIKHDGNRCNSPAMTGMNFCFHHIGGKVASLVREGATYDASAQLDFPYPADRESIQQSLHLVAQALREGKIDTKTANTYIRLFRLEEQNLHRWEKAQKETGKTKMQPPADAATTNDVTTNTDVIPSKAEESATNDVIPSEREEPAVSTPPEYSQPTNTEAIPNTDVILSKREARVEEPAFSPHPTTLVIPTDASKASGAEEPALPPPAPPTQPNKGSSVSSVSSVVNPSHPLKPAVGLNREQTTDTDIILSEWARG